MPGNHVHHIDLKMNSPMLLDLMQYLGFSFPFPQMSWYIQGTENHAIGVAAFQEESSLLRHLIINTERNLLGFISESSGPLFVFVQHSSMWLMCSELVCTSYGITVVLEISIQPSQGRRKWIDQQRIIGSECVGFNACILHFVYLQYQLHTSLLTLI